MVSSGPCVCVIQKIIIRKDYYLNTFLKKNMKQHMLTYFFMSMLYNKIKFEIDVNKMNYWKPSGGYKKGENIGENIIKFINFHLL